LIGISFSKKSLTIHCSDNQGLKTLLGPFIVRTSKQSLCNKMIYKKIIAICVKHLEIHVSCHQSYHLKWNLNNNHSYNGGNASKRICNVFINSNKLNYLFHPIYHMFPSIIFLNKKIISWVFFSGEKQMSILEHQMACAKPLFWMFETHQGCKTNTYLDTFVPPIILWY
jgi:hypothetical protein